MASAALATAFVNIVPGTQEVSNYLKKEFGNDVEAAGTDGGKRLGSGLTGGMKGALAGLGTAIAAVGITNLVGDLISTAEEGQKADATLANIASSMGLFGSAADTVVKRLQDYATAQMNATGVDDDAIKMAQAKLLTFADLAKSADTMGGAFDQATKLSLDLAAAGFGSVDSAAVMLGKALNDPIQGVAALRRVGVQLTDEQQAQIQAFMDVGDAASAQAVILGEVERQVGGTAEASATASSKLKAGWDDAVQGIATALLPAFQQVVSFIQTSIMPAVTGFSTWAQENPMLMTAIAAALGVVAVAVIALTAATWALNIAAMANPITWIVLGIVAAVAVLVAAILWLWSNWEAVSGWLASVFGPVINWIGGLFTWLYENIIKPVFGAIGAVFKFWWDYYANPIFTAVGIAIALLAMAFEWLYKNAIKPVFDGIGAVFQWLWNNVISPVFGWISDAVHNIGKVFETVFGAIGGFVRDSFQAVLGFIRGPVNAIIDLLNGMIEGLNRIKVDVPSWVPVLGGKTIGFNIPRIPKLADGGYVTSPTMALIGEAGPEVVTPLRDFERMMGVGNGSSQTIVYNAAPNQSLDAEQQLVNAVQRAKVLAAW